LPSVQSIRRVALPIVIVAAVVGIGYLAATRANSGPPEGTLYGNVEIRQVDLAFNSEGAVTGMAKREGDSVHAGEVIAQLDDATYRNALALAVARRDAAKSQLDLLLAGTRPDQIDLARANLENARAGLSHAEVTFARQAELVQRNAVSRQEYDDARTALDSARAMVAQTTAALADAIAGPRVPEIEAGRAQLRAAQASEELAQVQLSRTKLTAPSDGIVMTRVIEPGTVVLPSSAVYSVAITGEAWVRAFAPETLLGRVAPGTEVTLTSDGGHSWRGRIGYVSPVAEFTPKTVETPELRTQLVYRLRIRVENPDDTLRQGMPLTILLPPAH
jgi:HlyD family secretion protein